MHRILLVDDNEGNRLTLSVLLEEEGFGVETAGSLAEARERIHAAADTFHLALLDHNLGDGTADQLIPLLRQRFPAGRIVLLSGGAPVDLPSVDARFTKGEDTGELIAGLRRLLQVG